MDILSSSPATHRQRHHAIAHGNAGASRRLPGGGAAWPGGTRRPPRAPAARFLARRKSFLPAHPHPRHSRVVRIGGGAGVLPSARGDSHDNEKQQQDHSPRQLALLRPRRRRLPSRHRRPRGRPRAARRRADGRARRPRPPGRGRQRRKQQQQQQQQQQQRGRRCGGRGQVPPAGADPRPGGSDDDDDDDGEDDADRQLRPTTTTTTGAATAADETDDEKAERRSLPCLHEVLRDYADGGLGGAEGVGSDGRRRRN